MNSCNYLTKESLIGKMEGMMTTFKDNLYQSDYNALHGIYYNMKMGQPIACDVGQMTIYFESTVLPLSTRSKKGTKAAVRAAIELLSAINRFYCNGGNADVKESNP